MSRHREIYAAFFNICEQDFFLCEVCQCNALNEIHHIVYRSNGGQDVIENLIGLCRSCHNKAHDLVLDPDFLYECHMFHMNNHD